jgi:hypothetical protein
MDTEATLKRMLGEALNVARLRRAFKAMQKHDLARGLG